MNGAGRSFVLTAFAPVEPPPPAHGSAISRFAASLFATPMNFALTVLSFGGAWLAAGLLRFQKGSG